MVQSGARSKYCLTIVLLIIIWKKPWKSVKLYLFEESWDIKAKGPNQGGYSLFQTAKGI
jgi:hypothetical protein